MLRKLFTQRVCMEFKEAYCGIELTRMMSATIEAINILSSLTSSFSSISFERIACILVRRMVAERVNKWHRLAS